MKNVEDKVFRQRQEVLVSYNVFLTTVLAETALYNGSAVQAIFFFTFWLMGHANFFLKITTKWIIHGLFTYQPNRLFNFGQKHTIQ